LLSPSFPGTRDNVAIIGIVLLLMLVLLSIAGPIQLG